MRPVSHLFRSRKLTRPHADLPMDQNNVSVPMAYRAESAAVPGRHIYVIISFVSDMDMSNSISQQSACW